MSGTQMYRKIRLSAVRIEFAFPIIAKHSVMGLYVVRAAISVEIEWGIMNTVRQENSVLPGTIYGEGDMLRRQNTTIDILFPCWWL